MIILLAAVAEETRLIRQSLHTPSHRDINGIALTNGLLNDTEICLAHSGIGKAAAAAAAATLLNDTRPDALWLFGCGGAYPGSGLEVGDLALATAEIFGDEGVATPEGFRDLEDLRLPMRSTPDSRYNTWPVDRRLHDWAAPILAGQAQHAGINLCRGPFVTVSTCSGTTELATDLARRTAGICENMEGAAVALACRQMEIPLLEVRGISNLAEDRDTARWDLPRGMTVAQDAVMILLEAWRESPA